MGRGAIKQVSDAAYHEIESAVRDIQQTQNDNSDVTAEIKRTAKRSEQKINNIAKVTGAVSGGWSEHYERSQIWETTINM